LILVGGARTAVATAFVGPASLGKDAESGTEVRIGMKHIALQQIAVVILRSLDPPRVSVVFVALPDLSAQGEIRAGLQIKADEFERIPNVASRARLAKVAVVLVVSQRLVGGCPASRVVALQPHNRQQHGRDHGTKLPQQNHDPFRDAASFASTE